MERIILWLQGKKSYIVAGVAAVFNFGISIGWWTPDNATWATVNALLTSLFAMAIRAAITKSGPTT